MTKICCVCRRVEHGLHWLVGYEFTSEERISHGYCPLCFDVIMAELMEIKIRRRASVSEDRSQKPEGRTQGIDSMFKDRCDLAGLL